MGAEVTPKAPPPRSRKLATALASTSFVVLIAGLTYFAILAFAIRLAEGPKRAAAYRELGQFLSGQLAFYQDARVYGATALILAAASLLFGVHPLGRVTLLLAGLLFLVLTFYGDSMREVLLEWARQPYH